MKVSAKWAIVLVSVVCISFVFSFGFASYTIIGVTEGIAANNINVDTDARFLRGVEIRSGDGFRYQKYHYLSDNGYPSDTGGIYYDIDVSPLLLDEPHRVDNGNGGYIFSLAATLTCNLSVFSKTGEEYDYFSSVRIGTTEIDPIYDSNASLKFDVPFNVPTQTTPATFRLSCLFNNNLIITHADQLSSATFFLSLTGGSIE